MNKPRSARWRLTGRPRHNQKPGQIHRRYSSSPSGPDQQGRPASMVNTADRRTAAASTREVCSLIGVGYWRGLRSAFSASCTVSNSRAALRRLGKPVPRPASAPFRRRAFLLAEPQPRAPAWAWPENPVLMAFPCPPSGPAASLPSLPPSRFSTNVSYILWQSEAPPMLPYWMFSHAARAEHFRPGCRRRGRRGDRWLAIRNFKKTSMYRKGRAGPKSAPRSSPRSSGNSRPAARTGLCPIRRPTAAARRPVLAAPAKAQTWPEGITGGFGPINSRRLGGAAPTGCLRGSPIRVVMDRVEVARSIVEALNRQSQPYGASRGAAPLFLPNFRGEGLGGKPTASVFYVSEPESGGDFVFPAGPRPKPPMTCSKARDRKPGQGIYRERCRASIFWVTCAARRIWNTVPANAPREPISGSRPARRALHLGGRRPALGNSARRRRRALFKLLEGRLEDSDDVPETS